MKLSIIIAHRNEVDALGKTIKSIRKQSWSQWEVIVQDGVSQGLEELQKAWQNDSSIQLISEKDAGIYDAYNRGIARASGDYLLFFGAGDVLASKTVVAEMLSKAETSPDVIYANARYVNRVSNKIPRTHRGNFGKSLRWRNTAHHQATLYHARCFEQRIYQTQFRILADYEHNLWLWKAGAKAVKWEGICAEVDASGVSKRFDKPLYAEERAIKKVHLSPVFYVLAALFTRIKLFWKGSGS